MLRAHADHRRRGLRRELHRGLHGPDLLGQLDALRAVVEIFVKEGAKARYTTVQNWSKDVFNLNTKRVIVDAHGTVEWVGGSMGAKKVMLTRLFPMGEGARADHQRRRRPPGTSEGHCAKVVHLAPNTTSNILAKSISKDGIMGYRGLVRMGHNCRAPRPTSSATA